MTMALPEGAHWVSGRNKKLGVTLASGEHVTRQQAETMGARERLGLRNAYEERQVRDHARSLARDVNRDGMNYRRALSEARATAARRGVKFSKHEFDATVWKLSAHPADRTKYAGPSKQVTEPGTPEFRAALGRYLYLTGRKDRPVPVDS